MYQLRHHSFTHMRRNISGSLDVSFNLGNLNEYIQSWGINVVFPDLLQLLETWKGRQCPGVRERGGNRYIDLARVEVPAF